MTRRILSAGRFATPFCFAGPRAGHVAHVAPLER